MPGMFDLFIVKPLDHFLPINDVEANAILTMWKTANGDTLNPSSIDRSVLLSLKSKGFISGSDEIELTKTGRKILVEMITNEQNSFDGNPMPSYSKIKATARRQKQTFVKRASKQGQVFNLSKHKQVEAGVWDYLTYGIWDWWRQAKEWWGDTKSEFKAHLSPVFTLVRKIRTLSVITKDDMQELWDTYFYCYDGGEGNEQCEDLANVFVEPAALQGVIAELSALYNQYRATIPTVPELPTVPPNRLSKVDFEAFSRQFWAAIKAANETTAMAYEKYHVAPGAARPNEEDPLLEAELRRSLSILNQMADKVIPVQVLNSVFDSFPTPTGQKKLSEYLDEVIKTTYNANYIPLNSDNIIVTIENELEPYIDSYLATLGTPRPPPARPMNAGMIAAAKRAFILQYQKIKNDMSLALQKALKAKLQRARPKAAP